MADTIQREKLVELREMLRQRFPASTEARIPGRTFSSGLPELDSLLGGGLPSGAITEITAETPSCGAQWFLATLLSAAAENGRFTALVDRADAWDPRSVAPEALEHLLWVRCREAGQAIRAGDILVRDGNIPLIIMDMRPPAGSAPDRVPLHAWYRLQRCVEQSRCVLAVTSAPNAGGVPCCRLRLRLDRPFRLEHLDFAHRKLAEIWKPEIQHRGAANNEREAAG